MDTTKERLKNVADYVVLSVCLDSVAKVGTKTAEHLLYIRPHDPKVPDGDSDRSLFIANIPIDTTDSHFKSLFSDQLGAGRIERVQYETFRQAKGAARVRNPKKRKRADIDVNEEIPARLPSAWLRPTHHSGSTAVVVFVDRSSMELSWKATKKASKQRTKLTWEANSDSRPFLSGSQRYLAHHNATFPPQDHLQSIVDKYMTAFGAQEEARARALAKQRQMPDEDGFITVTRGGRAGPARQEAAQQKMEELKRKADEKKKGMSDFYRFQNREKKKQAAQELIQKFESDKQRIEQLGKRQKGRFQPM